MSLKRRNTSSAEPESPPAKRTRSSSPYSSDNSEDEYPDAGKYEQPQIDAKTGLASAFPGVIDSSDGGLFYGPAQNGIDYLRMVRSEATTIPYFLTAPNVVSKDEEDEVYEGFFDEDEAFIATPILSEEVKESYSKAQQAYNLSVLTRFYKLRGQLRTSPTLDAIQRIPESVPISFPPSSKSARETWSTYVIEHAAHPVQVASMDVNSAFELIRLITKKMREFLQVSDEERLRYIGTWLWALLAKCPDRGELGSEEISDLRACAKAANTTWRWLHNRALTESSSTGIVEAVNDVSGMDGAVGSTETKQRSEIEEGLTGTMHDDLAMRMSYDEADPMTSKEDAIQKLHVILDMIIGVVGEVYGQRDLLELRRPWQ